MQYLQIVTEEMVEAAGVESAAVVLKRNYINQIVFD
jgi:hypothetical protein